MLKIKGKQNYELLVKLRDALEISSSFVPGCSPNVPDK